MEDEHSCQAGTNTNNGYHRTGKDQSDSHNSREAPPGIKHSIRPDVPAPETVLVAAMVDGSYLLMAYPHHEPAAFVTRDDASLLRQALTAAFQSPGDEDSDATGRNGSGTHTHSTQVADLRLCHTAALTSPVCTPKPSARRPWSLRDRLDERDIAGLITAYRDGATAVFLAAAHGLSLRSVKRLLHAAGVRRTPPT